ncbi:hypothetical protein N5T77_05210 [Aliarcobacter cryaerophilus]|nr:hypothetical protein [Aliarcobacter cryaerophilus]MCT7524430.1 hypothetical protein [Aliarcobacter cryaerophilus]
MKKISVIVAGLALASSQASAVGFEYFLGAGAEIFTPTLNQTI